MSEEQHRVLRERYHVAKLAHFNVVFLNELQRSGPEGAGAGALAGRISHSIGFGHTPYLINQSTFLQFGYTVVVWLWEAASDVKVRETWIREFSNRIQLCDLPSLKKASGPREVDNWSAIIRLMRNALSHARVAILDGQNGGILFRFSDQNSRAGEIEPTELEITSEDFGRLIDGLFFAATVAIYPSQ